MVRLTLLFLVAIALTATIVPFALAASAPSAPAVARGDRSPAAPLAAAVSTVTGLALAPLLGTGAYGAYQWFTVKDDTARAALPWYAQLKFWLPALLIVGACAAKDAAGVALPPGLKKPFDVLELVENKITGLVAAGAVVPLTMSTVSKLIAGGTTAVAGAVLPAGGFAMIHFAGIDFPWLLNVLTIPLGIALFALVWMASHAINVLILLSPWGAIDAALKGARAALLGLLTLTAAINPWAGAALSVGVIVIAYFVAGWAFRLTVFGCVFSWGFLTRRNARFSPTENDNWMFAGGNLPGVPARTYGRLVERTAGGLEFFYRPWLVRATRTAKVPATGLGIGRGLLFSTIVTDDGDTLFVLPPRYRGHEENLVRAYKFPGGVRPAGLRKAWSALRELFGGGGAKTQLI